MSEKKALVFLAGGFEEVEALTPIDFLRRVEVNLLTVSISASKTVTSSRKIPVVADRLITELPQGAVYDALILPGGGAGASNLAASTEVGALLRAQAAAGRLIAAICAAPPVVLGPLGLLVNRSFTCYPGMEDQVKAEGALWSGDPVVRDGNLITSRGAGTAAQWSLAIIAALLGPDEAERLARAVVLR
ncbi:MAG: DJ-1/PfpI family protein [Spirochaetaceae bacterium]|jgi:4-methyl-5(b-hydroxyethyl)-thiazole monophosphate biosynthesis|nr:DJ-1/PfpI family protein [Spirochaetaceae bacterium]